MTLKKIVLATVSETDEVKCLYAGHEIGEAEEVFASASLDLSFSRVELFRPSTASKVRTPAVDAEREARLAKEAAEAAKAALVKDRLEKESRLAAIDAERAALASSLGIGKGK